jgi:protein TorT
LGVNYGLIAEARRLGVGLSLYEAGGYEHLDIQRKQIEDCLANDTDGLIISAISQGGLEDLIKTAADRGIPVLDMINGMASSHISARVAVDFRDTGFEAGVYLRGHHPNSDQPLRVAWFPGPDGAAWVAAGDSGFKESLEGSSIEIISTLKGDTGHATQSRLVEIVLDDHADELDYIVGTAVTAEAAVDILRQRGLSKKIKVLSYYYSPSVHRGIKRGNILAAPTDQQALQARIAVDVMVRILEKQDYFKHVAPRVVLIDGSKLAGWDASTTLAPRGFRPIFSINH